MTRSKCILCALVLAIACGAGFAGELDPPPGPIEPTMKPLSAIEPRIPIGDLPFPIDQPGSYYLVGDLGPAPADTDGITITASDVTLDLCGFALIGAGKEAGSSGTGVTYSGTLQNIAVRNGTIRDWRSDGLYLGSAENCLCEGLRSIGNGETGIRTGGHSIIRNCIVESNGSFGLTGSYGSRVEGNICRQNLVGIDVDTGAVVIGNVCTSNVYGGIQIGTGCTAKGNTCSYNASGINQGAGGGSVVAQNTIYRSDTHGINVIGATVTENTCYYNGNDGDGAGIHIRSSGCIVERNFVRNNDVGIQVQSADDDSYFASNRAHDNTTAYNLQGAPEGSGDQANVSF